MFVHSNEKKNYLFLCLCLFVDYKKQSITQTYQTRVPYYKEKKRALCSSIYKELELGKLEFTKLEFHVDFFQ